MRHTATQAICAALNQATACGVAGAPENNLEGTAKKATFECLKITATELAMDSKNILEKVVAHGEPAEIKQNGKPIAELRRRVGMDRRQFVDVLKAIKFAEQESRELKKAMDAASE